MINTATIIAVVLGIGAVVVYFTGAKQNKPWGVPLLVVLVIGAVVAVLVPRIGLDFQGRATAEVSTEKALELLGKSLAGDVNGEARVVVMRAPEPNASEGDIRTRRETIMENLEIGFGGRVELVGFDPPFLTDRMVEAPESVEGMNAVIDEYADQNVDAFISLTGLPLVPGGGVEIDQLALTQISPRPLFLAHLGYNYDHQTVRHSIQNDLLHAAVVTSDGKLKLITKDTLDKLPDPTAGGGSH